MPPPALTLDGAVAEIRLDRPDRHNCIEPADVERMQLLLDEIDRNRSIAALIVTGNGPTFCSGYDLRALTADRIPLFAALVDRLEAFPLPTICALNGPVYGGGADLALACDFRVAVESAELFIPAVQKGIAYYDSGIRRFVRRLGANAARRLLLLAAQIDAAEMLRIGFVDELVLDVDALRRRASAMAAALAGVPDRAVLLATKAAILGHG